MYNTVYFLYMEPSIDNAVRPLCGCPEDTHIFFDMMKLLFFHVAQILFFQRKGSGAFIQGSAVLI